MSATTLWGEDVPQPEDRPGIGSHERAVAGATDEWLTPPWLLDRLGDFDLDPCASIDRPWDTASIHYDRRDNGLVKPWGGRVWCNPPYSAAYRWLARLAHHGDGIGLVFARTETAGFFDTVWHKASALLFLRGRLTFHYPDGRAGAGNAGAPSVLVAYGYRNRDVLLGLADLGAWVPAWHTRAEDTGVGSQEPLL